MDEGNVSKQIAPPPGIYLRLQGGFPVAESINPSYASLKFPRHRDSRHFVRSFGNHLRKAFFGSTYPCLLRLEAAVLYACNSLVGD